MSEFVLQMKHIAKNFPGVRVLDDVTLQVRRGEVHALMGENGAGKSTLMKILMGIYTADEGEIELEGKQLQVRKPRDAMDQGIAMIHQELNPILDMQVFENIYIGREKSKNGLADRRAMVRETQTLLGELHIDIDATAYMRDLSVAQCQLIEIVKAISLSSKVIVMDEPTSAITDWNCQEKRTPKLPVEAVKLTPSASTEWLRLGAVCSPRDECRVPSRPSCRRQRSRSLGGWLPRPNARPWSAA